jgi:hypothetical protein
VPRHAQFDLYCLPARCISGKVPYVPWCSVASHSNLCLQPLHHSTLPLPASRYDSESTSNQSSADSGRHLLRTPCHPSSQNHGRRNQQTSDSRFHLSCTRSRQKAMSDGGMPLRLLLVGAFRSFRVKVVLAFRGHLPNLRSVRDDLRVTRFQKSPTCL